MNSIVRLSPISNQKVKGLVLAHTKFGLRPLLDEEINEYKDI
jgi:hypothetical protein